jgi:hypothetical protein
MSRKDDDDCNFDEERRLRRNAREGSEKLLELRRDAEHDRLDEIIYFPKHGDPLETIAAGISFSAHRPCRRGAGVPARSTDRLRAVLSRDGEVRRYARRVR